MDEKYENAYYSSSKVLRGLFADYSRAVFDSVVSKQGG